MPTEGVVPSPSIPIDDTWVRLARLNFAQGYTHNAIEMLNEGGFSRDEAKRLVFFAWRLVNKR